MFVEPVLMNIFVVTQKSSEMCLPYQAHFLDLQWHEMQKELSFAT